VGRREGGRKDGRGGEGEGGGVGVEVVGRGGWEGGWEEGRGKRGQGGVEVGIWGRAMTEAGTEDDDRLGGDWLRQLRLRLWCGLGGWPLAGAWSEAEGNSEMAGGWSEAEGNSGMRS